MNVSILSSGDRRHMASPPTEPPPGRRYLSPDELVTDGDLFWDGTDENWNAGASSFQHLAARHFTCVCRRATPEARPLREYKVPNPEYRRRSRSKRSELLPDRRTGQAR